MHASSKCKPCSRWSPRINIIDMLGPVQQRPADRWRHCHLCDAPWDFPDFHFDFIQMLLESRTRDCNQNMAKSRHYQQPADLLHQVCSLFWCTAMWAMRKGSSGLKVLQTTNWLGHGALQSPVVDRACQSGHDGMHYAVLYVNMIPRTSPVAFVISPLSPMIGKIQTGICKFDHWQLTDLLPGFPCMGQHWLHWSPLLYFYISQKLLTRPQHNSSNLWLLAMTPPPLHKL